ncbi:MAG: SurA N-terminal domain-containing protein, partial [Candidatus Omnitrophica bacterium]|nr:SurA N-terminal domain-containing protein [Candidatus Omnitrophota bacterium]
MQKITGVFLITFFFIFNVYAGIVAKTLAIVNNEIITTKDLQDYCMVVQSRVDGKTEDFCDTQDGLDEVLNMLIEDKLIITYAKKKDVEVSDSWVKGRLDEIAASYG